MTSEPGLAGTAPDSGVAATWAEELGLLASRVAHEVNNLMNGVAVNLEVVRSRSSKNAEASKIAPFAAGAADQLELLTPVVRSLIYLTRPAPQPVSLATELSHIVSVASVAARKDGGDVVLGKGPSEYPTCVSGATARLMLASSVRVAAESGASITCACAEGEGGSTVVSMRGLSGDVALPPRIVAMAADAGVEIANEGSAITLRFPPA